MSSSTFTSYFYLLTFTLLLQNVLGSDPIINSCSNENSTANYASYKTSLNVLMGSFNYLASANEGFSLGSLGQNNQDRPYGLVLCTGDVSSSDCRICVANATREIRKLCPNSKAALLAYDNCLLKYSNEDFFGQIDNGTKSYMWTLKNVSNPETFNQKTQELLSHLANQASYNTTKMYAAGELSLEGSEKLGGMVQCTRDLSSVDCKKCLDGAIGELQSRAYGKEWARFISGSCMVRYEIQLFVKA